MNPAVEFNPPVRFLQTTGHKSSIGVDLDRTNLKVSFADAEAKKKFHHLVKKLVVTHEKGLGATSSYKDVFADYKSTPPSDKEPDSPGDPKDSPVPAPADPKPAPPGGGKLKTGALFNYTVTGSSNLLIQLMKEASDINAFKLPGAATALLRSILEALLRLIIEDQGANPNKKMLSLEDCLAIALTNTVSLGPDDKKALKDFRNNHLDHINMSAHASVIPNSTRLFAIRDAVDQFIMRNI